MSEAQPPNRNPDVLNQPWYENALSDMAADAHRIALKAGLRTDLDMTGLVSYMPRDGIAKYILGTHKRVDRGQGWVIKSDLRELPDSHMPDPDPTEPGLVLRDDGALFTVGLGSHFEAVLTRALVPSLEDLAEDPLNYGTGQIVTHRILEDCYSALKAFELSKQL